MSTKRKPKFATQIDPDSIEAVHARKEDRQDKAHVDEALADLIDELLLGKPRKLVLAAYQSSIDHYGPLYQKLAE